MKVYKVGGAVRDQFLGIVPKDLDYVVTGSSAAELERLGYQRVGLGFPIFLHPITRHEYALPRGNSLKEDLYRRDLTINAMATDENGMTIDPFNGQGDLKDKTLRHVSDAFSDDPFRVYRVLRFKATLPDFTIAPETVELLKKIVKSEDFKTLSSDRLIKELRVVLSLPKPSIFFEEMKYFGALSFFFKELDSLTAGHWAQTMCLLDKLAASSRDEALRFSGLAYHMEFTVKEFCERILAPTDWKEGAIVFAKFNSKVEQINVLSSQLIVQMFYAMDGFRKPSLVEKLAFICEAVETLNPESANSSSKLFIQCFNSIKTISFKEVSPLLRGSEVGDAIISERVRVLAKILNR